MWIEIVFGVGSRLASGGTLLPLSCTWNVKLVSTWPLTGVKTSRLASRSAIRIESPAFTGLPLSVRLPASGSVLSTTEARLLAGVSLASVKPKSA